MSPARMASRVRFVREALLSPSRDKGARADTSAAEAN